MGELGIIPGPSELRSLWVDENILLVDIKYLNNSIAQLKH
jgi:hypothetical protein